MKVAELKGALLDYWVGVALTGKPSTRTVNGVPSWRTHEIELNTGPVVDDYFGDDFEPSTRWDHGGPIIERERIWITPYGDGWIASYEIRHSGRERNTVKGLPLLFLDRGIEVTPLIAAMRCFVASKLGEEVPDQNSPAYGHLSL